MDLFECFYSLWDTNNNPLLDFLPPNTRSCSKEEMGPCCWIESIWRDRRRWGMPFVTAHFLGWAELQLHVEWTVLKQTWSHTDQRNRTLGYNVFGYVARSHNIKPPHDRTSWVPYKQKVCVLKIKGRDSIHMQCGSTVMLCNLSLGRKPNTTIVQYFSMCLWHQPWWHVWLPSLICVCVCEGSKAGFYYVNCSDGGSRRG